METKKAEYKPSGELRTEEHPSIHNKPILYYFFIYSIVIYLSIDYFSEDKHVLVITMSLLLTVIYSTFIWKLQKHVLFYLFCYLSTGYLLMFMLTKEIYLSYSLVLFLSFLPFALIIIANRYLIDIPYALFVNFKVFSVYNIDLFTNTNQAIDHHKEELIYIDVYSLSEGFEEQTYKNIKKHYIRLIKFWYAQENYLFKLRYYFPVLALVLGIFLFFILLFILRKFMPTLLFLEHSTIMSIYLVIFYLSVTYHINSFLQSKFYMRNILKELNHIWFDNYEYRHQVKIFLDQNFLIYIHDRRDDRHICVNTNKSFQDFISKEKFDKEGRNGILTVFISFILILFIEVLVNAEVPYEAINSSNKDTELSIKKEQQ
ncbi:MAG: Unknown protein [uncultured Sulfurovum sp.]|uniref:Uncharacterized protein n=1 Tax=uncultured Sulfurovum sp. TaxID=269237 RepID=A0A6S6U2Z0_9BACT|nr:MAG: Unknown protein [uncultured Sulfurovum sp.]